MTNTRLAAPFVEYPWQTRERRRKRTGADEVRVSLPLLLLGQQDDRVSIHCSFRRLFTFRGRQALYVAVICVSTIQVTLLLNTAQAPPLRKRQPLRFNTMMPLWYLPYSCYDTSCVTNFFHRRKGAIIVASFIFVEPANCKQFGRRYLTSATASSNFTLPLQPRNSVKRGSGD